MEPTPNCRCTATSGEPALGRATTSMAELPPIGCAPATAAKLNRAKTRAPAILLRSVFLRSIMARTSRGPLRGVRLVRQGHDGLVLALEDIAGGFLDVRRRHLLILRE